MKGEGTLAKKGSPYTGTFMDLFSLSLSPLNNSSCVCVCVAFICCCGDSLAVRCSLVSLCCGNGNQNNEGQ